MKVFLSRRAKKALEDFPSSLRVRLELKISELAETPYPVGCKKLRGAPSTYRLRVGDYRILYIISGPEEIIVYKIASRESVYD